VQSKWQEILNLQTSKNYPKSKPQTVSKSTLQTTCIIHLIQCTHETETERFYTTVKYFKRYNGTGYYSTETYSHKINNSNSWSIANSLKETELEESKRFSMKRLIELAEQIKLESIPNIPVIAEAAR